MVPSSRAPRIHNREPIRNRKQEGVEDERTSLPMGDLGTANIARKNWQAIRNAPNCALTAVASRDLESAGVTWQNARPILPHDPPPRAYGSYEELWPATRWTPCISRCRR